VRQENCSADGKWQDFSGTLLPCVTEAQRAQPCMYGRMCQANFDGFCRRARTEQWRELRVRVHIWNFVFVFSFSLVFACDCAYMPRGKLLGESAVV
jgi:hypothetical protein